MQANLIDQGISLMLYGMGTVFVFLTVLVFATTLMSRLVQRFLPELSDETVADPNANSGALPRPQILKAIEKAIEEYRNR